MDLHRHHQNHHFIFIIIYSVSENICCYVLFDMYLSMYYVYVNVCGR